MLESKVHNSNNTYPVLINARAEKRFGNKPLNDEYPYHYVFALGLTI